MAFIHQGKATANWASGLSAGSWKLDGSGLIPFNINLLGRLAPLLDKVHSPQLVE